MDVCLGVDIGNSGLKIAALDLADDSILNVYRIRWNAWDPTVTDGQPGDSFLPHDRRWLQALDELVAQRLLPPNAPAGPAIPWLISSVRRDATQLLRSHLSQLGHRQVCFIDHRLLSMGIDVQHPEQVGIDRLLAAYAAASMTSVRPFVVIQAGSAVTVDLVTAGDGPDHVVFQGGAILPGVPLMLRLLAKATDLLPEIDAEEQVDLPSLPGKNTQQAMLCGVTSSLIGGVQHLLKRYRDHFGKGLPVILSGGDGMRIGGYLPGPLQIETHLVHRGLLRLARHSPSLLTR